MGVWGPGNFENDTAADHLSIMTQALIDDVEKAMANPAEIEPDEFWGEAVPCNIELLTLIAERGYVGCMLPAPEVVSRWKKTYMDTWERYIPTLAPKEDYKKQRRRVLEETFDALFAASTGKRCPTDRGTGS